jgi:hypothetical protein
VHNLFMSLRSLRALTVALGVTLTPGGQRRVMTLLLSPPINHLPISCHALNHLAWLTFVMHPQVEKLLSDGQDLIAQEEYEQGTHAHNAWTALRWL